MKMSVRSLDILDLPSLFRNSVEVLPLDAGRFYTRGNPLGATTLLSYLNPTRHIYTAVSSDAGNSLMGQVMLESGETSARLTFLAPAGNANGLSLPLLDHLVDEAGSWRAFHVLAEVDEDSPVFTALRQAWFSVYAWQRIWKLPALRITPDENPWREAGSADWIAVQSLHGQIVPALLQPADSLPGRPFRMGVPLRGRAPGICPCDRWSARRLAAPPGSPRFKLHPRAYFRAGQAGCRGLQSPGLYVCTLLSGLVGTRLGGPRCRARFPTGGHGQAPGGNGQGGGKCVGIGKNAGKGQTGCTPEPHGSEGYLGKRVI
jgi:hypothetical protein